MLSALATDDALGEVFDALPPSRRAGLAVGAALLHDGRQLVAVHGGVADHLGHDVALALAVDLDFDGEDHGIAVNRGGGGGHADRRVVLAAGGDGGVGDGLGEERVQLLGIVPADGAIGPLRVLGHGGGDFGLPHIIEERVGDFHLGDGEDGLLGAGGIGADGGDLVGDLEVVPALGVVFLVVVGVVDFLLPLRVGLRRRGGVVAVAAHTRDFANANHLVGLGRRAPARTTLRIRATGAHQRQRQQHPNFHRVLLSERPRALRPFTRLTAHSIPRQRPPRQALFDGRWPQKEGRGEGETAGSERRHGATGVAARAALPTRTGTSRTGPPHPTGSAIFLLSSWCSHLAGAWAPERPLRVSGRGFGGA